MARIEKPKHTRKNPVASKKVGPRPIPPCKGPKLSVFPHHRSPIEWLERLDSANSEEDDYEKTAFVFKVRIQSELYALKIFKFWDLEENRHYWELLIDDMEILEYHTDPFYAECRAYGRINQAREAGKLKRDLAIPCFGYLYLKPEDEKELEAHGVWIRELDDVLSASSPGIESQRRPIRGIVKKLASNHSGLRTSSLRRIRRDLVDLNKLQVYQRDVRKDNYRDGKLVDFGSSYTEPHCYMQENNKDQAIDARGADLVMFDDMLDEEGLFCDIRVKPNMRYKKRTRSRSSSRSRP